VVCEHSAPIHVPRDHWGGGHESVPIASWSIPETMRRPASLALNGTSGSFR